MAIGLDPITVAEAGPIMAKAMGFDWSSDRPDVVEYINKYRLLLYTGYDKYKLFDNVFHCIAISTFSQQGVLPNGELSYYQGFTVPNDVAGVEAVYAYGKPLSLRGRWRESHVGVGVSNLGRIETVTMAENFATERDMVEAFRLKIFAEREEDSNKVVFVEVLTNDLKVKRIAFTLVGGGFCINRTVARKVLSVSLPACRKGSITLMQSDNYELSVYAPWESVPNYRRLKIGPQCSPGSVILQGNKKFQKVYFDHDIVEVGNDLVIEDAGRYFKYGEATTEVKEIQRSNLDLIKMEQHLKGLIARHKGREKQDNNPFYSKQTINVRTLPGYKR